MEIRMIFAILASVLSYLAGSIPSAYIIVRLVKGIDIRKQGSGNVGFTNATRVIGMKLGAIVLLIDIGKGRKDKCQTL
jgi:glycerol-3-phosphate acyltransferase PlsY